MKERWLIQLVTLAALMCFAIFAAYGIAFVFPVFEYKYSKPMEIRPPKLAESANRLVYLLIFEGFLFVGGFVYLRWFNGREIVPKGKLLQLQPDEPLRGELLMPLQSLGYSPPAKDCKLLGNIDLDSNTVFEDDRYGGRTEK